MKTIIQKALLILMVCVMLFSLAACSGRGPVGFWEVEEIAAGDIVMTPDDAKSIGLNAIGTVKLKKSGGAEVTLLGEESKGSWVQAEDGALTITYGEKSQVLTGSIDEDGVMNLTDSQGSAYKLRK